MTHGPAGPTAEGPVAVAPPWGTGTSRPVRRRTLASRISVYIAAVVSLVLALMVVASAVALRSWMTVDLDHSLAQALHHAEETWARGDSLPPSDRQDGMGEAPADAQSGALPPVLEGSQSGGGDSVGGRIGDPGFDGDPNDGPGHGHGSLQYVERDGSVHASTVVGFSLVTLDAEQLDILSGVPVDERAREVTLPDLGTFRVIASQVGDGTVVLVGESISQIRSITLTVLGVGAALALLLAVTTAFVGRRWVRRELSTLGQVAATARQIGSRDLASDTIVPFERVPEEATIVGTEVGDVGLALNTMIENVEVALHERLRSEQRLRQFVADASHELRTPLASILGYTQLLQRESIEPEVALARVASESKRMSGLVEDLLLLARLDAGRELGREPVDLVPLVLDAMADGHAAAPDHEWRLDLPEEGLDACTVAGDEGALRQVLVNLVGNARVHTPAGTVVTIGVRRVPASAGRGPEVALWVSDNGPGIPEELRSTVFDRFVRGDSSRTRQGAGSSGLGLSIVSSIVQALDGRVELRTGDGGTTFEVVLPAVGTGSAGGADASL